MLFSKLAVVPAAERAIGCATIRALTRVGATGQQRMRFRINESATSFTISCIEPEYSFDIVGSCTDLRIFAQPQAPSLS